MKDGLQYAGEFTLHEAKLFSPSGEITDLVTDLLVDEINIFEDMFSQFVSGSIIVADVNDIITELPIMGQERLSLKISTPSQTEISISGMDKQKVGQVAAELRAIRPPEPYKGKGVRYKGEQITLKETKKAV